MVGLAARKCSAPGIKRKQYKFYFNLMKAVSRLGKLCKVPEINLDQLTRVSYSWSTLHSLISLPDDTCTKITVFLYDFIYSMYFTLFYCDDLLVL